jgi:hypothetical protein
MPSTPPHRAAIAIASAALFLAALPLLACGDIEVTELPSTGAPATGWDAACAADTDRVFSCTTDDGREVAICVGAATDPWVRFRLGPKGGAPELVFPDDRDGSLARFSLEDRVFAHGVGTALTFEHAGTTYEVIDSVGGGIDGAANNFTGIHRSRGGAQLPAVACGGDARADWERLSRTLAVPSP